MFVDTRTEAIEYSGVIIHAYGRFNGVKKISDVLKILTAPLCISVSLTCDIAELERAIICFSLTPFYTSGNHM